MKIKLSKKQTKKEEPENLNTLIHLMVKGKTVDEKNYSINN